MYGSARPHYNNPRYNNNSRYEEAKPNIKITFTDEHYVDEAEEVIKYCQKNHFKALGSRGKDEVTYSQLRNLLGMTSAIFDATNIADLKTVYEKLTYFRIQLVYTAGRNEAMKSFIETSHLLEVVKEIDQKRADDEKEQRREIIRLCKYMEALVAYFKYYGGKD